jgi:hypothetical protein
MSPLDLTKTPPRSPKAESNGLVMLPRMIDIARAKLPGGNPGEYQIGRGMSGLVLKDFSKNVDQFVGIVAEAQSDDEVYDRLGGGDRSQVSRLLLRLTVANVPDDLREQFKAFYGSDILLDQRVVDLLEEDDARMFPQK